jgi:hypothetical protein
VIKLFSSLFSGTHPWETEENGANIGQDDSHAKMQEWKRLFRTGQMLQLGGRISASYRRGP